MLNNSRLSLSLVFDSVSARFSFWGGRISVILPFWESAGEKKEEATVETRQAKGG